MYDPPSYIWAITIVEVTAIPAMTCGLLYRGAQRAGLSRARASSLAAGAAVVLGGWFTASAVIAHHGGYHTRLGHGVPWMPVAVIGFLTTLLALSRLPVVAAAMDAPGMTSQLLRPHTIRVGGVAFLLTMTLGHLPALFALPAGLGDITVGIAATRVMRKLDQGTGRRAAVWFNALGMTDLVVALTLGGLVGYQVVHTTPTGSAISALPLALIPTAGVPLLLALHVTSLLALRRTQHAASVSPKTLILAGST
jgi:hypothetical protein